MIKKPRSGAVVAMPLVPALGAEARRSLSLRPASLDNKFQANQSYIARPC